MPSLGALAAGRWAVRVVSPASPLIGQRIGAGRCGVIPVYRDLEVVDRCPILSG